MRIVQARFVTLCQQLLALGVVLAVLTPATGVVSLDIVAGDSPPAAHAAVAPATLVSATVPTEAVEAEVTEVPLTSTEGNARPLAGRTVAGDSITSSRVVSKPQPVTGFAAVGVTWGSDEELDEQQIALQVRTRTGEAWGAWEDLEYHDEHGPDAGSAEALEARPGTEPLFVGEVDDVQVQARTEGTTLPEDLSVSLISPGETDAEETAAPAIKGAIKGTQGDAPATGADEGDVPDQDGAEGITLRAARTIAQPTIYSRAQWGADERVRDQSNPSYGTINAGFVHHTVNANAYSEAEVPGIIRSIYAYHVKSRGWRDIGYNFLVDRFGRIWEGRYGGIDRPVIGAHTLGYNHASFAMSAIGNFETTQPADVMLRAYGQIFAWKLSLHGVDPASMSQKVGRSTFAAINGHRDAGSTACPGKYLYAQLPLIRQYAAQAAPAAPVGVKLTEPALQTNLVGSPHPDLVVRRASDGRGLILPTGGLTSFGKRTVIGKRKWNTRTDVIVTPDVSGDGAPDLLTSNKSGTVKVRPGKANGRFGKTTKKVRTTRGHTLLAAVGDLNGDGRNDLVGRRKGRLTVFKGTAKGGFSRKVLDRGFGNAVQLIGPGDVNGDGHADVLARRSKRLYLYAGTGTGTFTERQVVAGTWGGYDRLIGGGDYTGDGRADLVARKNGGRVFVLPGRGDGTFGAALGPASNLRSLRFLTGGGNLLGGPGGDLVGVSGKKLMVVTNRDTFELGAPVDTGVSFAGMNLVLNAGDVTRDGFGDVLARTAAGELMLFAGNGQGGLAAGTVVGAGWEGVVDLKAVGDVTGDGLPDLVGTMGSQLMVWPGTGGSFGSAAPVAGRLAASGGLPGDLSRFDWLLGVSDMQLRGGVDYVAREAATGRLYFYNGKTSGSSRARVLGEGMGAYDLAG